jgi:hypothetical protein
MSKRRILDTRVMEDLQKTCSAREHGFLRACAVQGYVVHQPQCVQRGKKEKGRSSQHKRFVAADICPYGSSHLERIVVTNQSEVHVLPKQLDAFSFRSRVHSIASRCFCQTVSGPSATYAWRHWQ